MEHESPINAIRDDLTAASERRWGTERTAELGAALQALAETLALVAAVDLDLDDAEPDFIR